jgi:hypothetical protein
MWLLALAMTNAGVGYEAAASMHTNLLDCHGETSLRLDLPAHPERIRLDWTRAPGRDAVLELRESGQDIVLEGGPEAITIPVPPRLGVSLIPMNGPIQLDIARLRPGTAAGAVELRLHCAPRCLSGRSACCARRSDPR